jgi:ABC-type nitrate/sulfonate/bicarbonate transport system substrate-binding protein
VKEADVGIRTRSSLTPHAAFLLSFLSACLLFAACTSKTPPPVEKVTVAVPFLPHYALLIVADEKGYFREEGLEVAFRPSIMYGKLALEDMMAGNADFAGSAETPLAFAVLRGESVCIVAEVMNTDKDVAIVALRNRGIESPNGLKGKKIGFIAGTTSEFFLSAFLTVHGIPEKSIRFVGLKPDDMAGALRAEKVDAVSIWNPNMAALRKEFGANAVTFFEASIYLQAVVVTARKKFVAERPEAVKKLLRALVKAEAFVRGNPLETLDIVARRSGKGRGEVESSLEGFDFRLKLGQSLLVTLENEARGAIRSKLSDRKEVPNFLDFFYIDGLKAVKPDAVTVSR